MIKRKLNLLNSLINMLIIYKYQCIQKCIEYVFSKLWLTYFLVRSRLRREICEYSPAVFQWNDWCWMSWKSAGDRNANKSPKIPYSTMVGKMDVIRNYYPWSHHHQKLTSSSDWYMALATFPVIMFTDSNFLTDKQHRSHNLRLGRGKNNQWISSQSLTQVDGLPDGPDSLKNLLFVHSLHLAAHCRYFMTLAKKLCWHS